MTGFNTYFIDKTGIIDEITFESGIEQLEQNENGYLWLDYYAPTEDNLAALIEPFKIHFLSLEDCLDDDQIPKINEYEEYAQVLFNTFSFTEKNVTIGEINLFIGKRFFISVSRDGLNKPGVKTEYKNIIEQEIHNAKMGPSYALHVILDYIVDNKFTAIDAVGDNLEFLENVMTESHNTFDQNLLQTTRKTLMSLRKSLFHEREIMVKICRNDINIIPDKALVHYNDIYDHITKFFELTEIYREMVTNLIQTNLAMINNDIAEAANATNISVKRLTLITTIFMPLTLLTGIGGMSEYSMMTGTGNWKIAYPIMLCGMMILAIADYYILKWIERKDK